MWIVLVLLTLVWLSLVLLETPPSAEGFDAALTQRGLPTLQVPRALTFRTTASLQPTTTELKWSQLMVKTAYAPAYDGHSATTRDMLRWCLSRGIRCLHLEVFFGPANLPVVGVSPNQAAALDSKLARDVLKVTDAVQAILESAFSNVITPNATDPLVVVWQLQTSGERVDKLATRLQECLAQATYRRFDGTWSDDTPFAEVSNRVLWVVESAHRLSTHHPLRTVVHAVANEGFVRVVRDRALMSQGCGSRASPNFVVALPEGNPHAGWLTRLVRSQQYAPVDLRHDLSSANCVNAIAVPYCQSTRLRDEYEQLFEQQQHAWVPLAMVSTELSRVT